MNLDGRAALTALAEELGNPAHRSRFDLWVSPGRSQKVYTATVLGIVLEQRFIIVTIPTTEEHFLLAVTEGQTFLCRWNNATRVFRFRARVRKVALEPVAVLYLEIPPMVEQRAMRRVPRALVNVWGTLEAQRPISVLIVNLSVSGARIALAAAVAVEQGQTVSLAMELSVLEQAYPLQVPCTVVTPASDADPNHPQVFYRGLAFEQLTPMDRLVIHAYVQERLILEADWLSKLLVAESD
jgi:hypothetical protein